MARYTPESDGAPLALLSLGVVGDDRPLPDLQPPLTEGIHLRWGFEPARGFPWYGFYLFRRPTLTGGAKTCVAPQFSSVGLVTPATLASTTVTLPLGTFTSDQNIHVTDDFAPTGTVELDLDGRTFLRFQGNPAAPSRHVEVKLGFAANFPPDGGGGPGDPGGPGPGDPGGPGPGDPGGPGPGDPGGPGPGGPGGPGGGGLGGGDSGAGACGCICGGQTGGVRPILQRVIALGGGLYRAIFGYFNSGTTAVSIPVGPQNEFVPGPASRGQPTLFFPGFHRGVFTVDFSGRPITWSLSGVTVGASSATAVRPTPADGILIIAFRKGFPVDFRLATGRAGDVVTVPIDREAIDSVIISSGPVRLIDLCTIPSSDGVALNWQVASGFTQPMCLPVRHPAYPCRQGDVNRNESESFALNRITYGPQSAWQGENFTALHNALVEIVQGGPMGGITDFIQVVTADADPSDPDPDPDPSDPDAESPTLDESSLTSLLMAALHPPIAQMLGLYWVDINSVEGQSYDYMLVADYNNAGGGNAGTILGLITAENFTNIEAYELIGARRAAALPLTPPQDVVAYDLPVGAVAPPTPGDVAGHVGLRWLIPGEDDLGRLAPDSPLSFHLWRKDHGRSQPGSAGDAGEFVRISEDPVGPGEMRTADPEQQLADWPSFGLFAVDGPLLEGWYGYRVSGIDIFGRHSARSDAAQWLRVAENPTPENRNVKSALAVNLLDTRPPPPPTQVKSWALDPGDAFVIADPAYNAWRAPRPTTIGLRVSWVWTGKHMLTAPDTREFRIYVNPGSSLAGSTEPESWQQRIAVVGFNEQLLRETTVPARAKDGGTLTGIAMTVSGDVVTLVDVGSLPDLSSRLTEISVDALELALETGTGTITRHAVLEIDVPHNAVKVTPAPTGSGFTSWTLGIRERTYEIFLPGASLAVPPVFTLPLNPSLMTPRAFGLVGVSAADDKTNPTALIDKKPTGPLSGRSGNEGAVGGPATIYQIFRGPVAPPASVFPDESLLATRADFKSQSFFTFHWPKSPGYSTHIYRALDESLFTVDALKGFGSGTRTTDLGAPGVIPADWSDAEKNAVRAEINGLGGQSDYANLSNRALRVLASFPSNVAAFSRLTAAPLGQAAPDFRGPTDPVNYTENTNAFGAHLDTLDGRARNGYFYRTSYIDDAHNAGLLGPSSPPVYLPPTSLPDTPVIRSAIASTTERRITLTFTTSRAAGVNAYHIYRTDEPARASDVRLMERIAEIPEVPPASRPLTRNFPDNSLLGMVTYSYRIVAVAADGRASPPSAAVQARAVDEALPTVPTLTAAWTTADGVTQATLTWTSEDETMLQERLLGAGGWGNLGTWRPAGSYSVRDPFSDPTVDFEFRLQVRKYTGAISRGAPVPLLKLP